MQQLANKNTVKCRYCEMDHWTTKCPYKDKFETFKDKEPTASGSAVELGKDEKKSDKYIPPSLREGGNKRGEVMFNNKSMVSLTYPNQENILTLPNPYYRSLKPKPKRSKSGEKKSKISSKVTKMLPHSNLLPKQITTSTSKKSFLENKDKPFLTDLFFNSKSNQTGSIVNPFSRKRTNNVPLDEITLMYFRLMENLSPFSDTDLDDKTESENANKVFALLSTPILNDERILKVILEFIKI